MWTRLGIGIAALLGAGAVSVAPRGGAGLTQDSMEYLAGAHSLAALDGFQGVDGLPQSLFPPGLSTVLAPGVLAGLDDGGARWINAVLVAATAGGVGIFLSTRIRAGSAVVAAVLTAVAYPTVVAATWVWSETLFVALNVVCLGLLATCGTTQRPNVVAVAAGAVTGAAVLTRYSGVTLLPIGVLALLLLPGSGLLRRVRGATLYVVVVGIVVVPWLARNLAVTGQLAGERFPSRVGLLATSATGATTLLNWIVPQSVHEAARAAVVLVTVAAVGVAAAAAVRTRRAARTQPDRARRHVAVVAAGYLVTTVPIMIVLAATSNINVLGDRLLVPMAIPLIVVLVLGLDACLDIGGAVVVAAALPVLVIGGTLTARAADAVVDDLPSHQGYRAAVWHGTDMQALTIGTGATISNQPWGVYALTGRPVAESPRRIAYSSTVVPDGDIARLRDRLVATGPVRLVWVVADTAGSEEYHLTPEQLAADGFGVRELTRTRAGAVYEVTAVRAS